MWCTVKFIRWRTIQNMPDGINHKASTIFQSPLNYWTIGKTPSRTHMRQPARHTDFSARSVLETGGNGGKHRVTAARVLLWGLALIVTGCATTGLQPPGPSIMYPREGHQLTTSIVAGIAGLSAEDVHQLSFFSQAPDDMTLRYSAVAVGIWGSVPLFWGYRSRINSILHSLHGGGKKEVDIRHQYFLQRIHDDMLKPDEPRWQVGFMIHAMGDSYAHTKGHTDNLSAYSECIGHIFAFKNKPDTIVANNNSEIYVLYVRSLYKALRTERANPNQLEHFIKEIEYAAMTGKQKNVDQVILDWYKFPDENMIENVNKELVGLAESLSMRNVDVFLRSLKRELALRGAKI